MDRQLFKVFEPYFKIGAAVNSHTVETHAEFIKKHFNLIVCENEMKYEFVANDNGEYDFTSADKIHDFAVSNNISMHTHTFVWHNSTRDIQFEGSREDVLARLRRHMEIFNERYPDITTVDVLNEAIDDKHGLFLRETRWLEKLGEKYFIDIFKMAREINPNWKLYYNDYNEYVPEKREKILRLVNMLRAEGLIDGVGLQSHLNIFYPPIDELKRSFEEYSKLGLDMRVSELDISLFEFSDKAAPEIIPQDRIDAHSKLYADYLMLCREYSELVESVTFWGTTDDSSWLNYFPVKRYNPSLLFDKDMKPKAAFDAVCGIV